MANFSVKLLRRWMPPPLLQGLLGLALLLFVSAFPPSVVASSLIASLANAVNDLPASLSLSAPGASSAASVSSHRRLGPDECTTYVYTNPGAPPTEMKDHGSCPTGGGSRAFLLDTSPEGGGGPSLLEVSPVPNQQFVCRPDRPCSAIMVGFGLQAEDSIAVLNGVGDCPPRSLGSLNVIRSEAHITSSTAVTFHYLIRPQANKTELPIFNLNILQGSVAGDKFTVCYSPSLATRGRDPSAKDFHYNAGVVRKCRKLFLSLSVSVCLSPERLFSTALCQAKAALFCNVRCWCCCRLQRGAVFLRFRNGHVRVDAFHCGPPPFSVLAAALGSD